MQYITKRLALASAFGAISSFAQQPGTQTPEKHPALQWSQCSSSGCQPTQGSVVLDSNWRWTHNVGGYTNCYKGTEWDSAYCPDPVTCAKGCALDGADYINTYGVNARGNSLELGYVVGADVGSRVYMMDENDQGYEMFKLKNREFTFTVDVSNMPCGINGALYFVSMDADGGQNEYANNNAGAKFGTGYCDAQCPHDIKFINGEANILNWNSTTAMGKYGTCCDEMDIWEANKISQAYTAHPCQSPGQIRCEDPVTCGDGPNRYNGECDKDGCDLNTYRLGETSFFGPGGTVDTASPVTVVTQFHTDDGTDTGNVNTISRLYVQNGKVINTPNVTVGGASFDGITDPFCDAQKKAFGDNPQFEAHGGLKTMSDSFDQGMVLVMSIWDDAADHMLWLDSIDPPTAPPTQPGAARGTCATSSGVPADVRKQYPGSTVTFSDIKLGTIGSTYQH